MNFKGIEKKEAGKFITRYDITYETVDNQKKVYEIISRKKNMETYEALHGDKPDAVVIIATNETGDKLLVNKEFRLAVGDWVYNFPAGLIDPGEKPQESARRELWEETGLELINVCVVGKARGEFRPSTSTVEEITPCWLTRQELRELLKTERFAARTQAYCYLWSR